MSHLLALRYTQHPSRRAAYAPTQTSRAQRGPSHAPRAAPRDTNIASTSRGSVAGIDLGTTNSAIAVLEGDTPVIVPNAAGDSTTPSVVSLASDGEEVFVGITAKRRGAVDPLNTFYSVKRLIGQFSSDVDENVAYETSQDEHGMVTLHVGPHRSDERTSSSSSLPSSSSSSSSLSSEIYPEEVSAIVLAQLLEDARNFKNDEITRAVISVPAYFNDEQKDATVAAGEMAGLQKVRLLREPVAAALAYGVKATTDQTVLVFDLGGGTFDVSLLEVGGGVIEVLSTGGDPHLGGDDFDRVIVEWLEKQYLKPAGVDTRSPQMIANLKTIAEAAKMQLSVSDTAVIRMPVGGGIEAVLTRQKFEALCEDLFRRAREPVDYACWQAGIDLGTSLEEWKVARKNIGQRSGGQRRSKTAVQDLDVGPQLVPKREKDNARRLPVSEVLLVGGATRMPAVRTFVENMTGLVPKDANVDPDLAVALGAAIQAGVYEGNVSDVMIMDVWQASLMRAYATVIDRERQGREEEEGPEEAEELELLDEDSDDYE